MNIYQQLSKPFALNQLHWVNKGKGGLLAHLTSRDVMKRLDEVVGQENWADEIIYHPNGVAVCNLSIRIGGEWITKSDASGETNFEAEKGASATAFKRAAVKHGIGRYLYYLPASANPNNMPPWATPEGYVSALKSKSEIVKEMVNG